MSSSSASSAVTKARNTFAPVGLSLSFIFLFPFVPDATHESASRPQHPQPAADDNKLADLVPEYRDRQGEPSCHRAYDQYADDNG